MEAGSSRVGLVGYQLVTIPIWPSCHLNEPNPESTALKYAERPFSPIF